MFLQEKASDCPGTQDSTALFWPPFKSLFNREEKECCPWRRWPVALGAHPEQLCSNSPVFPFLLPWRSIDIFGRGGSYDAGFFDSKLVHLARGTGRAVRTLYMPGTWVGSGILMGARNKADSKTGAFLTLRQGEGLQLHPGEQSQG